jgi:type IV pilus assembly protein PilQ
MVPAALAALAALAGGPLEILGAAAGAGVQLTAITSRSHADGVSLAIQASEPVAYVTTRPDPLTVVVDFRNVDAPGLAIAAATVKEGPIARVLVESTAADVQVTRIRVALTEPVAHRVRSERSAVIIDLDKPLALVPPAAAVPARLTNDPLKVLEQLESVSNIAAPEGTGNSVTSSRAQTSTLLPAPAKSMQAPSSGGTSRTYTGHPVSLDFQDADLRAVLRTFAEISGLNVVIDPTVQGSVNVALTQVPWDQALDQILRANKLGYVLDGTIVRIAPLTVLAEEEKQRSELAQAQAEAGQLRTLTRQLSYAKGEDLVRLLTAAEVLSARGQAFTDVRTNTLIITDLEERLASASSLIDTLDRAQPQVEIEARIVQTTRDFARALGVQWGFNGRVDPSLGNTTNLAFPNSGSLSGNTNVGVDKVSESFLDLALGSVNGAFDLDVALSALERNGNGRLLSTPRVSTQNNVAAEIMQGRQIPIQTVANNTVTVQFIDAALKLRVTPQISAAGTVIMAIELENSTADFGLAVNGIPPINTERALTTVLVKDGETTVIGGIYLSSQTDTDTHTPGLGRVPVLRWLFKRNENTDASRELVIFITPRIVQGVSQ